MNPDNTFTEFPINFEDKRPNKDVVSKHKSSTPGHTGKKITGKKGTLQYAISKKK